MNNLQSTDNSYKISPNITGVLDMVHVLTRDKCPVCGAKFINLECPNHPGVIPKNYYLYWYYQGMRFRLYGFDSYKMAFKKAGHVEQEITDHSFKPENYKASSGRVAKKYEFSTLVEKWLERREKDADKDIISPAYYQKNEQAVRKFKAFFGKQDVRLIRKDNIREFIYSLSCGQKTQKNYANILNVFLSELVEDNIIHSLPPFPKIKPQKPDVKWADENTQSKVVEQIAIQHRPIILFMMATGCRVGEARAIQWEDICFKTGTITIRHAFSGDVFRNITKSKRERVIPLMPEVREIVQPRGITGFVFNQNGKPYGLNSLGKIWRRARKKVGITDLNLYGATRHSKASQLVRDGVDIVTVKNLLGHSDIATTQKYVHSDLENMRVALGDKKRRRVK